MKMKAFGAARDGQWTKALADRTQRGTLHNSFQVVRGDSGKWNDEARFQHAPPLERKPPKVSLDDWADQLLEQNFQVTSSDDNWLLFRTRQLDDNDRVWVAQIERRGNQFTVVLHEAVWQGRYQKNFTQYHALGVNLGKLPPGKYEAKWIVQPYRFNKFEGNIPPPNNWPAEERPAEQEPQELVVNFTVASASQ
jgi:hypothetical protein